jgi:hypothetical protein
MDKSKILSAFVIVLFFIGVFAVAFVIAEYTVKHTAPTTTVKMEHSVDEYYILSSTSYTNLDNIPTIVFDYAKNGEVQVQALFETTSERDEYIRYLDTLGTVLNKKALNKVAHK